MQALDATGTNAGRLLKVCWSFVLYSIAGAVGTAAHFAVLFAVLPFLPALAATTAGALVGCVVNYLLACEVVFAHHRPRKSAFIRFATVASGGILINAVAFQALLGVAPVLLAQAAASSAVLITGYFMNRWWTFDAQAI